MDKETVELPVGDIKPYSKNEKVHTNDNLKLIEESIKEFGYVNYIIVDEENVILAGHGRFKVLKDILEYDKIMVTRLNGLSKVQKDKFRLYDNQSSRTGHYDNELLLNTIDEILAEDDEFNISILSIDGLADSYSLDKFDFDLGDAPLSKATKKSKCIIILTDEVLKTSEILKTNGINFILGSETKR